MSKAKKPHLVTTRLSDAAIKRLEAEMARQDRSRSETVRRLMERALECPREDC